MSLPVNSCDGRLFLGRSLFGSGRMLLKLTLVLLVTGSNAGEIALDVVGAGSVRQCGCGSGGKTSSSSKDERARCDRGTIVSIGNGTWFDLAGCMRSVEMVTEFALIYAYR